MKRRLVLRVLNFLLAIALLAACGGTEPPEELRVGATRSQVVAALGEPDEREDFLMPDGGFFGPQEALTRLVPPGEIVEQWVYQKGDELTYVWFAGRAGAERVSWTVVAFSTAPADAVY